MIGIAQCKKCLNIYRFPIVSNVIPPCPKCYSKSKIDDEGFLINGLNPDDMYSIGARKEKK